MLFAVSIRYAVIETKKDLVINPTMNVQELRERQLFI
jgi:hypothetical protein